MGKSQYLNFKYAIICLNKQKKGFLIMQFHERIRALREDNELNQEDIAQKLNTNQKRISRLELNLSQPTISDIIQYCKIFNVSADYILGISDSKK